MQTEFIDRARDALTAERVFGEPFRQNGLTVIPAATVRGGGGGGGDESPEGKSSGGGGLGLAASPVGAWVIHDGDATWKASLDVTKVVVLAELVVLAGLFVVRGIVKDRARTKVVPADVLRTVRRFARARVS